MSETTVAHEVRLSRRCVTDSTIVVGDVAAWLAAHGAKVTKQGINVRGWRCSVLPLSRTTLERIAAIIGPQSAAARALRGIDSVTEVSAP